MNKKKGGSNPHQLLAIISVPTCISAHEEKKFSKESTNLPLSKHFILNSPMSP